MASSVRVCGSIRYVLLATALALLPLSKAGAEHADAGGAFAGHTMLLDDQFGGVAVEYMSADGRAYLWYRGEAKVVAGRWRLKPPNEICFSYPGYVFDYAPSIGPGEWFCMTFSVYYGALIAKRDGDRFELSRGSVPFKLRMGDFFGDFSALRRAASRR